MDEKRSRRYFVKTAGTAIGAGAIPAVSAGRPSGGADETTVERFKVVGTKKRRVRIEPETITIETTYKSRDLKRRYGVTPPKFTETETYDRSAYSLPDLPDRDVRTSKERWETYFAMEEEWKAAFENGRAADGDFEAQHDHESEDKYCGRAVWNYEKHDPWFGSTSYDRSAPINLVLKGVDVTDVEDVLSSAGWNDLEFGVANEGKRYAWDKDREKFVGPDQEPKSEYTGWGTSGHGPTGRMHVRCYELESGIVSVQAHEDGNWDPTKLKHDVVSYESARQEMVDIFTNNWPYLEYGGRVDSGPDGWGDDGPDDNHDGTAIVLEPGSITPDPIDRSC